MKVHVDMLTSYGVMGLMLIGNERLEWVTVCLVLLCLFIALTSRTQVFVNFFITSNPNPAVAITMDDKDPSLIK